MWHATRRSCPATLQCEVLPGGHAVHPVRRGSGFSLSVGGDPAPAQDVRILRDAGVHPRHSRGLLLYLEKRSSGLGEVLGHTWGDLMPCVRDITDRENLNYHPE